MAYTETTSTSWFSRLGSSFGGIGLGFALFLAGTALLWWNEGDFVSTGDALKEAQAITQELGDISKPDPALNGKLVHATGLADTKDVLTDPVFGIQTRAIRLTRNVEYYQWVEKSHSETRKKLGGGEETVTTYTYEKAWKSSPVNSSNFKDMQGGYRNYTLVLLEDFKVQAQNVSFGAYRLPEFLISSISGETPLDVKLSKEVTSKLEQQIARTRREVSPRLQQGFSDALLSGGAALATEAVVHVEGATVYLGNAPGLPEVGDMRITFKQVLPETVSLLAKLNGTTFETYRAANGKAVSRLSMGTKSLEGMYGDAHSSNVTMTWIFRALGVILVIMSIKMILAPLAVIASVVPLFGDVVAAGSGLVATLLGLAWSLIIIAIAWLRFRPLIGGGMLAAAVLLIALLYVRGRKGKAAAVQQAST